MNIDEAKEIVIKAGVKLVKAGLIARTWGNVSCRIDEENFVITPSGRDYLSLTLDEIVSVRIDDLSYKGNIKPSSEKGIHAEVYKIHSNINFVIHTHQVNASVIGATRINSMKIRDNNSILGRKIICAKYALPGTNALRKNITHVLKNTKSKAVIMKYHGALCFGKDYDEAFSIATELEKESLNFLVSQYIKLSKIDEFDYNDMCKYALSLCKEKKFHVSKKTMKSIYNSKRTDNGFVLFNNEEKLAVEYDDIDDSLPEEAKIYSAIYNKNKDINYIVFNNTPEILEISNYDISLKPLIDDFAQIIGSKVKNVKNNPDLISQALKKSPVIFIRNLGALCCSKTLDDVIALNIIMQKTCKAYIGALLFGEIKPINPFECMLMRFVYLKKYSKKYIK